MGLMPQKKSAMKRLKQDKKKHSRNKTKISEIRTLTKKVISLIAEKDKNKASLAMRNLESKLRKASKTNTVKKNTVSRKVSRLASKIAKI